MVEITSEEQNKVKRMRRTEDSLRDLWDNIKCTNTWIIGVPEEEYRLLIAKMIKNLESKMEKMQESINKDLEELKNKHIETNNTITEIKNTLEGINSTISEAEEWISELEDKMVKITSEEQSKVKRMKKKWG